MELLIGLKPIRHGKGMRLHSSSDPFGATFSPGEGFLHTLWVRENDS